MPLPVKSYRDLRVYQLAMDATMEIFKITKNFPVEEKYSLTDQIRRSSRSVCANIAEAWRKRRYQAAFISKLNDAETEACETQVWLEISEKCNYVDKKTFDKMDDIYDHIISQLIRMINKPEKWVFENR